MNNEVTKKLPCWGLDYQVLDAHNKLQRNKVPGNRRTFPCQHPRWELNSPGYWSPSSNYTLRMSDMCINRESIRNRDYRGAQRTTRLSYTGSLHDNRQHGSKTGANTDITQNHHRAVRALELLQHVQIRRISEHPLQRWRRGLFVTSSLLDRTLRRAVPFPLSPVSFLFATPLSWAAILAKVGHTNYWRESCSDHLWPTTSTLHYMTAVCRRRKLCRPRKTAAPTAFPGRLT